MVDIKSKLPQVGTTIFTVMSKMAQEHGAINLSQGFPDFEVSRELIKLVSQFMQEGHNQYAPMAGVPALRKAVAQLIYKQYGFEADFDTEITITAGATEAIFDTISALVHPHDEVIVFDPAYDCYDPAIRLSGGKPIHLVLQAPAFHIDWELVENSITDKTRLILINTPHNPTGSVLGDNDLQQLERLTLKHENLLVLSDEVYEHILFDGHKHCSVLRYPHLAQKSISVSSFGKTFHATGWKVGYVVAPARITGEIRKVHQFVTFSVNTPVQLALAAFLGNEENYHGLSAFYEQKRNCFLDKIRSSGFTPLPCRGTYFQLLSFTGMSEMSDREMAGYLTKTHKIASIPISGFYEDQEDNKLLRFCFAKNEATLTKAAEILCRI